jgi:hypothetical protein
MRLFHLSGVLPGIRAPEPGKNAENETMPQHRCDLTFTQHPSGEI